MLLVRPVVVVQLEINDRNLVVVGVSTIHPYHHHPGEVAVVAMENYRFLLLWEVVFVLVVLSLVDSVAVDTMMMAMVDKAIR